MITVIHHDDEDFRSRFHVMCFFQLDLQLLEWDADFCCYDGVVNGDVFILPGILLQLGSNGLDE